MPTPNSNPSPRANATVREAKPSEFAAISQLARRAFVHDPVFNYFGSVKKLIPDDIDTTEGENLHRFFSFLLRLCSLGGGRITVAVISEDAPTSGGETREKIVPRLVRGGIVGVLRKWGLNGLMRVGFEYLDASHASMTAGYKVKAVMTDPDHAGQVQPGLMSLLMREAFAHAGPGTPFTLEATTSKSRDRYQHLGYEAFKPLVLGPGKVNELGVPASKAQAVGLSVTPWYM
ncbi:hypothetical protein BD779DRAFT_1469231 [Infundibulicybe gibba]|nr:hypothetical protein BD779DRAFT_1469231 [Infundibulicybe gibba]